MAKKSYSLTTNPTTPIIHLAKKKKLLLYKTWPPHRTTNTTLRKIKGAPHLYGLAMEGYADSMITSHSKPQKVGKSEQVHLSGSTIGSFHSAV